MSRATMLATVAVLGAPGLFVLSEIGRAATDRVGAVWAVTLGATVNTVAVVGLSLLVAMGLGVPAGYRLWRDPWPFLGRLLDAFGSLPAILAGMFGLRLFVEFAHLGFSLLAGGLSLGLLNLAAAVRLSEAVFAAETPGLLAAGLALGRPEASVYVRVVRPAARAGLTEIGRVLAARAAGEAAVLMLTAGVAQPRLFWPNLWQSGGTLAVRIWYLASQGEGRGAEATIFTAILMLLSLILYLGPTRRRHAL